jgi:hypothetical protein
MMEQGVGLMVIWFLMAAMPLIIHPLMLDGSPWLKIFGKKL